MQVSLDPLRFLLPTALPFFLFFTHLINGPVSAEDTTFSPELFAFQTGFANASSKAPEDLVKLVHQAGFDGVELMGLQQVERFLPALKQSNLKLHSLYLKLDLDRPDQPVDPNWSRVLREHGDDLHAVWFHVHSQEFPKSDPVGDDRCVEILRSLSDQVKPWGIKIGIYHHVGLWAEQFSDGVRVARKVDRDNVGAVFNLCHYLKTAGPSRLEQELGSAFPHVLLVSINGADDGETQSMGWDRLIQPLDQGSFDVARVLRVLKAHHYDGPVGLQGYAIREKPEDFFPRSVDAYQELLQKIKD